MDLTNYFVSYFITGSLKEEFRDKNLNVPFSFSEPANMLINFPENAFVLDRATNFIHLQHMNDLKEYMFKITIMNWKELSAEEYELNRQFHQERQQHQEETKQLIEEEHETEEIN